MRRVLVCDRALSNLEIYRSILEKHGFSVAEVSEPEMALKLAEKQPYQLCLWALSDDSDLNRISKLKFLRPTSPIIVLSQNPEPSQVVKFMRAGANDFWDGRQEHSTLIHLLNENLKNNIAETCEANVDFPFSQFVGRHPKILEIFQLILSIKDTDSNVLITGESGTGKEVVARAIHDLSPRKKLPWVAVNCGAIPATLLESELFGHMRGAFTGATQNRIGRFQLAGSGTLFLDEIGDLSLDLQAKILRAIQQKVFEPVGSAHSLYLNARIIAATNQNLEKAVEDKKFREDLFYRLNVIPITMPPLRERKSDIPLLVKSFIERFATQHKREVQGVSEDSMRLLMQYQWPGNIRELENLIERVVILKRNPGLIEIKDLPIEHFKSISLDRHPVRVHLPESGLDLNDAMNDFENELIIQALQKTQGNKNKAAILLNLNRTTLVEKLKRKGLKIAV